MDKNANKILFSLSFIISVLVLVISATGISDSLYTQESASWRVQCWAQDLVDLALITPFLMVSALMMLNGHLIGRLTWPGVMLYLIYTFTIYCFDVHFNYFFIEYCVVLGLSIYTLAYFLYSRRQTEHAVFQRSSVWIKLIACYLLLIGILFYLLWLSQIIPAIRSGILPKSLAESKLPTNPVHVLDLSFLLPLFIIASILLFRKRKIGLPLAASLLVFSVLMDTTIVVIDLFQEDSLAMRLTFIGLGLISLVFLTALTREYKIIRERHHDILWEKLGS